MAEARAGGSIAVDGAVGRDVSEAATDALRLPHRAARQRRRQPLGCVGALHRRRLRAGRRARRLAAHAAAALRRRSRLSPALGDRAGARAGSGHRRRALRDHRHHLRSRYRPVVRLAEDVVPLRAARRRARSILRDRKPQQAWKRKPDRGFAESCTALLEETPERFARRKARAAMVDALATAAEKNGGLMRARDLRRIAGEIAKKK